MCYYETNEWDKIRKAILKRDKYKCTNCCRGDRVLHVHHITPKSEGGDEHQTNLKTLCVSCHGRYHEDNYYHDEVFGQ